MNPYSTHLLYKNVFTPNIIASANSQVILAADFDNIQFSILAGLNATIGTVVGTFVVGELVTGGTSSATGRVVSFTATTIVISNVSGTFQNGETITGGTSGATAVISAISVADFTVLAFKSNQQAINGVMNPPNPALPPSPTNEYEPVMYTGEAGGVNYDSDHPWDAGTDPTPYAQQSFKFATEGARWVFLRFVRTTGALVQANIDLFNN